tara:strand:+ start:112 stop:396 length:285 start_codon:yes stop_codon:yes gene_type:complete
MADITQPITATTSVEQVASVAIALTVIRGPFFRDGEHFFYLATDAQRSLDTGKGVIIDDSFSLFMPDDASNSKYHEASAYLQANGSISYTRPSK